MYRSVLLKHTIVLVLSALLVTTVFTTVAFALAGNKLVYNVREDANSKYINNVAEMLENNSELIKDDNFVEMFFNSDKVLVGKLFLVDDDNDIILGTPTKSDAKIIENVLWGSNDAITVVWQSLGKGISGRTLKIDGVKYKLLSICNGKGNDIANKFINVFLLSTLCSAFIMLIPVYFVVRKIVSPIQQLNQVAQLYGAGNYYIRANENVKGESGELASSFNNMANKLTKSINDLTIERNRLQDVFDVISEGIVVVDDKLKPIFVNKAMDTIFDKVNKRNLFAKKLQLIPFENVWDDYAFVIESGESKQCQLEGHNYAFEVNIVPKFSDNNIVGATGFFRDVYDEMKLERTRQDYVANISHELRTPLQTLRGLVEPLCDGIVRKEEDKQRYYEIILNETMRLSRLINDMLELSKLQSGTLAFKTFPFDLEYLLENLETKYMSVMMDSGINFKVKCSIGNVTTVIGNPDRVEQILVILLDNARKHTPDGGSIIVSAESIPNDDKIYISVKDTGQGMHESDLPHIFERFFKVNRARGKTGTGLGLAIAKELLVYMGEDITVESEYGVGTTFTFTLHKATVSFNL